MGWYQIYDSVTGVRVSETSRDEDCENLPGGLGYLETENRFDTALDTWDPVTRTVMAIPVAILTTFDPNVSPIALKKTFDIASEIGIQVVIVGEDQQPVVGLTGEFTIPILRWDASFGRFTETVKRLRLDLVDGVGVRTFSGFIDSGDYGVDQRCTQLARILEPYIIQISE